MNNNKLRLLLKMTPFGVVTRDQVKNDLSAIKGMVRNGLVKKAYKRGKVFYELTQKAIPLLNGVRLKLQEEAKLKSLLHPRKQDFYRALLDDVRFLDTRKSEAKDFLFLGDWRLHHPPVLAQLLLSQLRFYQKRGVM